MPENREERTARRVDRLISELQAGRRLGPEPEDAAALQEILAAASLQGAQETSVGMSPAFRRRIASLMQGRQRPRPLSRRAALVAGLTAAGGLATGAALGRLTAHGPAGQTAARPRAPQPAPAPRAPVLVPQAQSARWVDVGIAAADLREGEPRRVSAGSVGVFVVRRGEEVLALSAICTHQPCELSWQPHAGALACPCHNQAFDLQGQPMASTYVLPPLPLAMVRVRDGRVEVLGT